MCLRKDHLYAFAPTHWDNGAPFAWKEADNTDKTDWSNRHLMIHYYDSSAGKQLCILINMDRDWTTFRG